MSVGKGHPRTAGTYSRILKHYVRELRSLTLMDAIFRFVLVGGTPVVDGGRLVEGVRPGHALTAR